MYPTKNAELVEKAESKRIYSLRESATSITRQINLDDASASLETFGPWVRALNYVNNHITVPIEEIQKAIEDYNEVAKHLISALGWSDDKIEVIPQGSASTQTLIRSPGRDKFDIDAVCQVDISYVTATDPVGFFNTVGQGLRKYDPKAKNRCWNINCTGQKHYLEFTPSVPLNTVSNEILSSMSPEYMPSGEYLKTALAVTDNATRRWKTSNPAGFTQWVNDTAKRQLIKYLLVQDQTFIEAAGVTPVPEQEVEITDALRIAIRLFKRHRDMCVYRNDIDKEFKPISVIIVTILTSCYAGLVDLGRTYNHPIQLLVDLAELMPGMVDFYNSEHHVDNPTVPGENFAEKWNTDGGRRHDAYTNWCDILINDLKIILNTEDEHDIQRKVRDIFGCTSEINSPNGPGNSGISTRRPNRPTAVPVTSGLA